MDLLIRRATRSLLGPRLPLLPAVLGLVLACRETSTDEGAGAAGTQISGGVVYHSLNKQVATTAEYSGLDVSLIDQNKLLGNPNPPAIATSPLASKPGDTMGLTAFSFPGLDLEGVSTGIVTRISDTRSPALWVTTESSSIDAATLATLQASGGTYDKAVGFALSHDAVAGTLATLTGLTGDEILARGMVFGLVYGGIDTDGSGVPVSGATVSTTATGYTIVYPNSKFDATQASTGGQGAFFAIPPSASSGPVNITFDVTAPAGQSLKWDETLPATVRANAIFFLRLYAK